MDYDVFLQFNTELFDNAINTFEDMIKRIEKSKNEMFYYDGLKTYVKIVYSSYSLIDYEKNGKMNKDVFVHFVLALNVQDGCILDEESKKYLKYQVMNIVL